MLSRHFYLRSLVITTIKVLVLSAIALLVIQFIASYIPIKVHALVMILILVLATFLFGEWIFSTSRMPVRGPVLAIVLTYAWESFLNALLWGFIMDQNYFFTQSFSHHLMYFTLHAIAMGAALYDVKRLGHFKKGPIEGLV